MTSTITTTNTDRTRWQARGLRLLNEVWQLGAAAGLRPLMWQLGVQGVAGSAPLGDEATLRAWAGVLGIEVVEAGTRGAGRRLCGRRDDLALYVDLLDEDGDQ